MSREQPITDVPPPQRRPLRPIILLHLAVAVACFTCLAVAPIAVCLVLTVIGKDAGGPMFLPMFVIGAVMLAAVITMLLGSASLLSSLLRRRFRIPLWLPPLVVFVFSAGLCWLVFPNAHPAVPPLTGAIFTLAFAVHWAATATVWFLPRWLFRRFGVAFGTPKG